MAVNQSVERFRKLTEDLKQEVRALAVVELNTQADALVSMMQHVAPTGPTGELRITIKKIPDKQKQTIVRVVAGGPLTTEGERDPYDYSRAVEFGTIHMPAQPFFFPTYRLMRPKMRATMKRKLTASIKKRSAPPG